MSLPARRDPQALVHRYEGHEAEHDRHTQQQTLIRLHQHRPDRTFRHLSQEYLRQEMKECIAQQSADGKGDHDVEGAGVDIRRAQSEEEVGRAGDVEGSHQAVEGGGGEGEEEGEGSLEGGGCCGGVGVFVRGEGLEDGTLL